MTAKKSKAVKAAPAAMRPLLSEEVAYVLNELGLVRAPRQEPPVTPEASYDSGADDLAWLGDLMAAPGEGIGFPRPNHMTPEERAIHLPPRPTTIANGR